MRRAVACEVSLDHEHVMQKLSFPWSETEWQKSLSEAVVDLEELLTLLNLKGLLPFAPLVEPSFQLRVPRGFIARMRKADPYDPLLMQVLPLKKELFSPKSYSEDPLQERDKNYLPGLLHKYANRVLVVFSSACAINCRYCFRRHFSYADNNSGRKGWADIFAYIQKHAQINEIILSGGDPLTVNNHYLAAFIQEAEKLTQIKRLRIHTRLPIVLPERITQGFINALNTRLKTIVVIHANHPHEIDETVETAIRALQCAGIVLFNQSVLLKNINDSCEVLKHLSEKLFSIGVLPYYLHLLDKVKGVSHFAVSRQRAKHIMQELATTLPGYLVPKLVEEKAGAHSKVFVI